MRESAPNLLPDYFSRISYLMLETNSSCNLSCKHCNRSRLEQEGKRDPKNITKEEFQFILNIFKKCPIDTIKLEGLSEPMLHPEFDELAENLRHTFSHAFIIIATNGQYQLARTPFLKTLPHVDMVYLSIDGTGNVYERMRPGAKYERMLSFLEDLRTLVPVQERKTKLFINFTLSPENYRELPFIYDLKGAYNLAGVRINLAQNWNEDQRNELQFGPEILSFLAPYKEDIKGVGGWEYRDCFWPTEGIVIDVYGDIRQCVINTSQTPLANVFKDDIKSFYNSSRHYLEVRKALAQNCSPASCVNCDYHFLSPILQELLGGKYQQNRPRSRFVYPDSNLGTN